ncbi:hypothetical protein [Pseudalkalibacillus sp. SCS-8]|uniref:hypothetical protein n=1 Tax=Pseudalkalibacillus nanhaiensis TaxID=3115291 RepID=UPI0032D9EDD8
MENVLGYAYFVVQFIIILYVIFSLASINHKLSKVLKGADAENEGQSQVSNEEIEKELEEQMDKP